MLANQYDSDADALADFDAVRKLYTDTGIIDTYDAAVITHTPDGKVKIVKRVEEPTRYWRGMAGHCLAAGAAIALFPALGLGLGAAFLGSAAIGTAAGAVVGHVAGGLKRTDLKELGEQAGIKGKSGLWWWRLQTWSRKWMR